MKRPAYQTIKRSMVLAAILAAAGAVLLVPSLVTKKPVPVSILVLAGATCGVAVFLLAAGWRAAHRFGLGIERLRSAVLNLVSDRDASLPAKLPEGTPAEILAMLQSLAAYQDEVVRDRNAPDHRLLAVLGALSSGVVVVTDQGQVSVINQAARDLLGETGEGLFGTPLYDEFGACTDWTTEGW